MKLHELAQHLDDYLQVNHFDEAAYNGIQVANTGLSATRLGVATLSPRHSLGRSLGRRSLVASATADDITRIATAVTASLETIERAAELGVQALIVHHGIFRKQDAHPIVGVLYKKIKLLMEHNIALLGYHLPLDAHQEIGNNWHAARDLGMKDLQSFGELSGKAIGVIGSIAPTSFDVFKQKVEQYYHRSAQSVKVRDPISTVAIISGGADRFIIDAAEAGVDCFITGRVDEPVWDNAHEYGISFLGLGHYGTETVGPQALAGYIQKALGIPCEFIKTDNPF